MIRSAPLPVFLIAVCCFIAVLIGADMTAENDENARDALRAGTVVPVALGLILGVAYLGYAHLQRQIAAQHAFGTQLQPLKQKIHEMTAVQSQTDAEVAKLAAQSQPPKSVIQGLQNHVDNLHGRARKQKK
jgi:uncharacterized membrane protein YciS (DUF1049 family)